MGYRTGLAAQFGVAAETTFSTRSEPDHFYEIVSETLNMNRKRTEAKGIRPNKIVQRSQRFRTTSIDITGDVMLEMQSNKYGLLLKHCLGASAITADGAGYKHQYTIADTYGLSLTAQVGTPGIGGVVTPREYVGCKISNWEFSTKLDSTMDFKVTFDGVNESTAGSLATPTWPSTTYNEVFYVDEVVITVGGNSINCNSFTITGANMMKTDRYFLGSQLKKEQVRNAQLGITGTIESEFIDMTLYNLFINDTIGASSAVVVTATGQLTYDTGKYNKLVLTLPSVRYDGTTPNVSGPDIVPLTIPFSVHDNDTGEPITIDLYNSDSTD